jgi:hypothetical protein
MQKQGQICRMLWKKACANRSKFNVVNEWDISLVTNSMRQLIFIGN